MKIFFLLSFFLNTFSIKQTINRKKFYDFIKYGGLLFLSCIIFGLMIGEQDYLMWLIRENTFLLVLMLTMLFVSSKIRFEFVLIYFIFIMNILHIVQSLVGYREPLFYSFVDMLLLPGVDRDVTIYSAGVIGSIIHEASGVYLNRMNLFFDQPSTYFIIITLLSFVLLFHQRDRLALCFFVVGFLSSPTKFGLAMVVLFFAFYLLKNRYNFSNKMQSVTVFGAIFTITYLPFIIGILGNIIYEGNVVLDYVSTIESRIYWSWLYGNGYMPWEAMATVGGNESYGVYDGIAAKVPFLFASIVAWFVAPRVRHFSLAMILTVFLSIQYGINMTLVWLFFVLAVTLKTFFENSKRSQQSNYHQ